MWWRAIRENERWDGREDVRQQRSGNLSSARGSCTWQDRRWWFGETPLLVNLLNVERVRVRVFLDCIKDVTREEFSAMAGFRR
jgi:hypothetical protein